MIKRSRRVKILATLGPASSTAEAIRALLHAGADVFRINMSHTSHAVLGELVRIIRALEAEERHPIGILVDLQGPKLRIGEVKDGEMLLAPGSRLVFDKHRKPGERGRVCLPHPEIFAAVEVGHALVLNDGKIRMQVVETRPNLIVAETIVGGPLGSRKGISLPDTLLGLSAMTDKDRLDLRAALDIGIDWIALSFVQRPEDVQAARQIIGTGAAIMSKIEKPQALAQIEEIIALSDGIMVARGDLGVELPVQRVPGVQKQLTRMARAHGKPVVIATQMLESMIVAPVPTRAEVSDVATAVFEGADTVMLSAESAAGRYPVEAVRVMSEVATEVERDPLYDGIVRAQKPKPDQTPAGAIAAAACTIAADSALAAVVCYTATGATALRTARQRPSQPVLALTPEPNTARRLALVWGLNCVLTDDPKTTTDMVNRACRIAQAEGFAAPGERIIVVAGLPFGTPGATNTLRIAKVGGDGAENGRGVASRREAVLAAE